MDTPQATVRLDEEGRLQLPVNLREALGWEPGQEVHLEVRGEELRVSPAGSTGSLKSEARRLASAMRDLAKSAAQVVQQTLSETPAPTAPPPGPTPPTARRAPFLDAAPRVPDTAYVAPGSTLIGDVVIGEDSSIWPGVVIRGDVAPIRVGARTNIQDGAVLHVSPQMPCVIGAGVTVGHQATLHACRVADDVLIGIQAVVLDGAEIGDRCIIAAGSVVPPGTKIPPGKMVMGVPGRVVRDLTPQELERIQWNADAYVTLKDEYRQSPQTVAPEVSQPAPQQAQPPTQGTLPRYECRRVTTPIQIDGSLDESGWAAVPALSSLTHSDGTGAPQQPTEVKACWDDEYLYVSFACKDTDIWANYTERDDPLYDEEVVEVFLCPTGDLRHYFEFEVSPANVLFDAKVFNPDLQRETMLVDREWDSAGMRTAVRVAGNLNDRTSMDLGWITELAIPFTDLGLAGPPKPGDTWRVNFYRIERGPVTEYTAWSPTYRSPADFHVPECFGELVFVD